MLQGAENIDCFGDYSLTFSNVCGRERGKPIAVSVFPLLLKCLYLPLRVRARTRVNQTAAGRRGGETAPRGKPEGKERE